MYGFSAGRSRLYHLLTLRVWFSEKLRVGDLQCTLFWAGLVGGVGGLAAVAFQDATRLLHELMTGQTGGMVESFGRLPPLVRLAVPMLGGVAAGAVILLGRRLGRSRNTTDYMEAVVLGNGEVSFRSSAVKIFSSMFTIASGGSIGREGPMVQLSALCASLLGKWRGWSVPRMRLMVACGAAAGIASAYNAPIAGALFVAEIILGTIAMESFGPLVFSSVMATQVVRYLHGGAPLYRIPAFTMESGWELAPYALLGLLAGVLAPWFLRSLRWSEQAFIRLPLPLYLRTGLGGLVVGIFALSYPQVCGNGYSVVSEILNGQYLWPTLATILVLRVAATCAVFGSGAVGGVFTPTLFAGAGVGYLFGLGVHGTGLYLDVAPGAFALAGMGMFLAATTHAPLMAILMIFEMTLDYQIILPLMLGSVIAYYVCQSMEPRSIYSATLQRKGGGSYSRRLVSLRVADLLKSDPPRVAGSARFAEVAHYFVTHPHNYLYVVDDANRYNGVVSLHDVKSYLDTRELADLVIAREIMRTDIPSVHPGMSLDDTLDLFARHDGDRLPVVSPDGAGFLLGVLSKTDVLLALADRARSA